MEGATGIGAQLNTALTTSVAPASIMTEFLDILPWVGLMVGVAFLIYEGRKLIKGASKGKVRV